MLSLLGLPTLIAGLILRYASPPLFASAHSVGHILILITLFYWALLLAVVVLVFCAGFASVFAEDWFRKRRRRRNLKRRGW